MTSETTMTRAGGAPGLRPMLGVAIAVVAIQATGRPVRLDPETRQPMETRAVPEQRIDVNADDAATLCAVPGIGPVTARAIVRERQHGGGYTSLDDLARVNGIGPMTIRRMRRHVTCAAGCIG